MQICTTIISLQKELQTHSGKTIGFIPTMGALHQGHLSLIQASQKKCDLTVVSIFVNPTQFSAHEDLDKYPRPLEKDKKLLKKNKVDLLFLPSIAEIYPNGIKPKIPPLPEFTKILEGKIRPTHFLGVAQVVQRFFEIIQPTHAFFGQKDFQQALLIKWLIQKFNLKIKLEICPIIREKNGLALSSRNQYLSPNEKEEALILSQTLTQIQKLVQQGEKNTQKLEKIIEQKFNFKKKSLLSFRSRKMRDDVKKSNQQNLRNLVLFILNKNQNISQIKLEYAVICNKNNLSPQTEINQNSILLLAVKINNIRLIDNCLLIPPLVIRNVHS